MRTPWTLRRARASSAGTRASGVRRPPRAGTCASVWTVTGQLHDRWPATPQSIAPLRRAVIELATRSGATARQQDDIALAVSEAVTNVIRHAYPGRELPGIVAVHAAIHRGSLDVAVSDEGVGMPPPAGRPGTGLGLAIIARVADRLELSAMTPGTRIRMTFAIG
jgi:serine/threonine-protein kinase RsbW